MSMTIKDIHTHRPDAPRDALADIRVTDTVPDPARLSSAGLHPWDVTPDCREALDEVARLARHPLVAAIGECGIDRLAPVPLTLQTEAFVRQAEIADGCGKPLIIHAVRATADILALHRRLRPATVWIIHGFRGKPEAAAQLTRRGIRLSRPRDAADRDRRKPHRHRCRARCHSSGTRHHTRRPRQHRRCQRRRHLRHASPVTAGGRTATPPSHPAHDSIAPHTQ